MSKYFDKHYNHQVISGAKSQNKWIEQSKRVKNCARKWCQKLCAFLFEASCAFRRMYHIYQHKSHLMP